MINAVNPFSQNQNVYQVKSNYDLDELEERKEELEFRKDFGQLTPEEEYDLKQMSNIINQADQGKQTKSANTTNNNPAKKESDVADRKEKKPINDAAGLAARHYISMKFNRSIIDKLTRVTPATVIMDAFGIDLEECGNALKKGAATGKGGDFNEAFKGVIKDYDKAIEDAMKKGTWATVKESFKQVLGFIPNCGAALVNNALKYVGKGLSKVFSKELLSILGSGTAVVGKLLNSIGDSVGNILGGTFNGIKELLKGNTKKAGEAFKNIGNKFKEIGVSIKNKVVELAKDVKNWAVDKYNKAKEGVKVIKTVAEEGWKYFKNGAKKLWKKLPWNR